LKQEKEEILAQLRATHDNVVAHGSDKAELQAKHQEEKSQLQKDKEKLLAEQTMVKEAVDKACHFVRGLA
jgi:hypothetical protein